MQKKEKIWIAIVTLITIVLKLFFFYQYNTISNDDFQAYIPMSNNIFENGVISLDGVTPHTIFPPGYPFLLGIEKTLLGSFSLAFLFNFVFVTTGTGLFILYFYRRFISQHSLLLLTPFLMLYPLFTISNKIINASSEYLFMAFVWGGLFLLYKFLFERMAWKSLFSANLCFAIAYLIRPEGLLFVGGTLLFTVIIHKRRCLKFKYLLAYLTPLLLFVLPYIYYLYQHLGYLTFSGKHQSNIQSGLSMYDSKWAIWGHNLKEITSFITSPNLFHPLLTLSLLYLIYLLISRHINKAKRMPLLFLLLLPLLMMLALINYHPYARALIAFMPALILAANFGLTKLIKKLSLPTFYTSLGVALIFLISTFAPLTQTSWYNAQFLYKKAIQDIDAEYQNKTIGCRFGKFTYYTKNEVVPFKKLQKDPSTHFLLFSTLNNPSLPPQATIEKKYIERSSFTYKGIHYKAVSTYGKAPYIVKVYKKK